MANPRICSVDGCGKPAKARGWCNAHWIRWSKYGDPKGGGSLKGEALRFIQGVVLSHQGTECLIWPFGHNGKGYGVVRVDGVARTAHRYVCELVHGKPPTPEHEAAHSCGNGHIGCVCPVHLGWKTPAENQADRVSHGTHNRGERCGSARLTEADVREIRALQGLQSQKEIASRFGISDKYVSELQLHRKWAWLA